MVKCHACRSLLALPAHASEQISKIYCRNAACGAKNYKCWCSFCVTSCRPASASKRRLLSHSRHWSVSVDVASSPDSFRVIELPAPTRDTRHILPTIAVAALLYFVRLTRRKAILLLAFLNMMLQFCSCDSFALPALPDTLTAKLPKIFPKKLMTYGRFQFRYTDVAVRAAIAIAEGRLPVARVDPPTDRTAEWLVESPAFQWLQSTERVPVIGVVLFVDKFVRSRFIGKSLMAIYGYFPNAKERPYSVFEVAHLPATLDNRDYNQIVAAIVTEFESKICSFNSKLFRLRLVFLLGDLPGRIGFAQCPGMLSSQGGCPHCLLTKEQMADFDNRAVIENGRVRRIDDSNPLSQIFAFGCGRMPVDPMHCLYLGLVKLVVKRMLIKSGVHFRLGTNKDDRKTLLDELLPLPFPASYKTTRPLQHGEVTHFSASHFKIMAGIYGPVAGSMSDLFRRMWLWLRGYICAVETVPTMPPRCAVEAYWRFASCAKAAGLAFVPNLHAAYHLALDSVLFGPSADREADQFEKKNAGSREDILHSGKKDPWITLIRHVEERATFAYHFPTLTDSPDSLRAFRLGQSAQVAPGKRSKAGADHRFYWSPKLRTFCRDDGASYNLDRTHGSLLDQLLQRGYLTLVFAGSASLPSDAQEVLGLARDKFFYFDPITPGWQPASLALSVLSVMFNSFSSI